MKHEGCTLCRIELENVGVTAGNETLLSQVNFHIHCGELTALIGPNGAGKSTTMRMVTGFIPPSSGTAVICGHDILKDPVAAKSCIGYLPENAPSYRAMTVEAFLEFIAKIRGFNGAAAKEKV